MAEAFPSEFRDRAIELARSSARPAAEVARELGISPSCLRNWLRQARVDAGEDAAGLSSTEKQELVELRRRNRQLELENDVLKRAAAYFARENILPK